MRTGRTRKVSTKIKSAAEDIKFATEAILNILYDTEKWNKDEEQT